MLSTCTVDCALLHQHCIRLMQLQGPHEEPHTNTHTRITGTTEKELAFSPTPAYWNRQFCEVLWIVVCDGDVVH